MILSARPGLRPGTRSRLACLRPRSAAPRLPDWGSFLKLSLGRCVLFRIMRPRLQRSHAKPAQGSLPTVRSATLTRTKADAISACKSAQRQRHATLLPVQGPVLPAPARSKLLHLGLVQRRRASRAATRTQSDGAFRVVAQHPVAQRLPIHAIERCAAASRGWPSMTRAIASSRRTTAPSRVRTANSLNSVAEYSKRVISIGLPIRVLSMRIVVERRENPTQADSGIPKTESIFRAAGIRPCPGSGYYPIDLQRNHAEHRNRRDESMAAFLDRRAKVDGPDSANLPPSLCACRVGPLVEFRKWTECPERIAGPRARIRDLGKCLRLLR